MQLGEGDVVKVDEGRVIGIEVNRNASLNIEIALGTLTGPLELVVNEFVRVDLISVVPIYRYLNLTNIVIYGKHGSVVHTGTPVGVAYFLFGGNPQVLIGSVISNATINLHLLSGSDIEVVLESGLRRQVHLRFDNGPARAGFDGFYVKATVPIEAVPLIVADGNVIISYVLTGIPPLRLYDITSAVSGQRGTITFVGINELILESVRLRQMRNGWNDLRINAVGSFLGLTDGFYGTLHLVRLHN